MFNLVVFLSKHVKENNPAQKVLSLKSSDFIEVNTTKFFRSHSASIEINFYNKLHRVFFPIHPICRLISRDSKKKTHFRSKKRNSQ